MGVDGEPGSSESVEKKKVVAGDNIKLWAYLDITNPLVAWEVAIGRICSADDPSREIYTTSLWFYSLMRRLSAGGVDKRFLKELLLERVRLEKCPDAISRLRGVYFFESEEAAIVAVERWGVSQNRQFISEVNFSANAITRVDSEWITWNLLSEDRSWMPKYWAGEVCGDRPLIEVLASGIGFIGNMELRHSAMQWIYKNWPESTPLLSMAACALKESSGLSVPDLDTLGLISPILETTGDGVHGKHTINIKAINTHQDVVIQAVRACHRRNEAPLWIVSKESDTFFRVPDLSAFQFNLTSLEISEALAAVHSASISQQP